MFLKSKAKSPKKKRKWAKDINRQLTEEQI